MTPPLTPERRAELRDDAETYSRNGCGLMATPIDALLALLDAADERNRLAARLAEVERELERRRALDRDWPADFADENGNYMNTCVDCARVFSGHKRRVTCRECHAKAIEIRRTWQPPPADLAGWRALLAEAEAAGGWVIDDCGGRVQRIAIEAHGGYDPEPWCICTPGGYRRATACVRAVIRIPAPEAQP